MLRIHGNRASLLAALTAQWVDQQLQIPPTFKPLGAADPPRASADALNVL